MQETKRQTIDNLLKAIGDCLHEMDDREFDLLLQGKGTLRFTPMPTRVNKQVFDPDLYNDAKEIARQLRGADSRDAAREVIASIKHRRRRDYLVLVARASGVRVGSKDSIANIEHKLIEALVGSKLRSRAFREVAF